MNILKKKMSEAFLNIIINKFKYPILFLKWFFSKKFLKYFLLTFSSFFYGHGEKPWKIIRFSLIIVFLFAIFFSISGIATSPENIKISIDFSELIFEKETKLFFDFNLVSKILKNTWECLYFSTVTFTTLGYGDIRPVEPFSQLLAGMEAYIGLFMMAFLSYTLGRSDRRRR
jgi:hypothetical protein